MVAEAVNAHKCMKVYYTDHRPHTCFGHSCCHLQAGALQRQVHWNITEIFYPLHKYKTSVIFGCTYLL